MIELMKFEGDGPWDLPIVGFEVGRITFGPDVDLVLDRDDENAQIGLSGPFEFRDTDGSVLRLDPSTQPWEEIGVLLRLLHDRVASATATNDSSLHMSFESGRALSNSAHPDVESWDVTGEDYKIIGMPGGGEPAIWDEDSRANAQTGTGPDELNEIVERWREEGA
jgi:hypothetical protein